MCFPAFLDLRSGRAYGEDHFHFVAILNICLSTFLKAARIIFILQVMVKMCLSTFLKGGGIKGQGPLPFSAENGTLVPEKSEWERVIWFFYEPVMLPIGLLGCCRT